MADWIFQGSPREHDLDARIAASPEQWWGTPRYRDRMAVGDRVWAQVTGPHHPGIYYVATIVSATYEHPLRPGEPAYARVADGHPGRLPHQAAPAQVRAARRCDARVVPAVSWFPGLERAAAP
jgi:hypothetical protein